MFDLQFYNMIAKCYIIMGQNCRMIEIIMNTRKINNYALDIDYVNKYSDYVSTHVKYFNPNCGYLVNK